jgi:hypothetical protein
MAQSLPDNLWIKQFSQLRDAGSAATQRALHASGSWDCPSMADAATGTTHQNFNGADCFGYRTVRSARSILSSVNDKRLGGSTAIAPKDQLPGRLLK